MGAPVSAEPSPERILVPASLGRDAEITASLLRRAELQAETVEGADELARRLQAPAAAVILTWESLDRGAIAQLSDVVSAQPPWSDLPFLVFSAEDGASAAE